MNNNKKREHTEFNYYYDYLWFEWIEFEVTTWTRVYYTLNNKQMFRFWNFQCQLAGNRSSEPSTVVFFLFWGVEKILLRSHDRKYINHNNRYYRQRQRHVVYNHFAYKMWICSEFLKKKKLIFCWLNSVQRINIDKIISKNLKCKQQNEKM